MIDFKFMFICIGVCAITEVLKLIINKFVGDKWSKFIPWILLVIISGVYWIVTKDFSLGILNGAFISMCSVGIYQLFKPIFEKIKEKVKTWADALMS